MQTCRKAEVRYARPERSGPHRQERGESPSIVPAILARIAELIGDGEYRKYFRDQVLANHADGILELATPTQFVADLIQRKFGEAITRATREVLLRSGEPIRVRIVYAVDRQAFPTDEPEIHAVAAQHGDYHGGRHGGPPVALANDDGDGMPRPRLRLAGVAGSGAGQNSAKQDGGSAAPSRSALSLGRYRLEEFILGDSNRLAFSAAEQIAAPGKQGFALLFIHGSCGLGKTHLLQGAAHRFRQNHPGAKILCLTGEEFMNEYVAAVRGNRLDAFRKKYRALDMLCIDDIQFLSNKNATQGELLHTFNAINLDRARVLLASDEHPHHVNRFSRALISRFMSGMVVKVDAPEQALRQRIAIHLAERRGIKLQPTAASLIASCASAPDQTPSVRDIEGAITRISAMRRLMPELATTDGDGIGLMLVRKALGMPEDGPGATGRHRRPVRITDIIEHTCRTLRVQPSDLMGKGRHKRVVMARAISAHLARSLTTLSYPDIARALGRPNHSTVVTACKRLEEQLKRDETLNLGDDAAAAEFASMTVRALCEHVRQDVVRAAPGV